MHKNKMDDNEQNRNKPKKSALMKIYKNISIR